MTEKQLDGNEDRIVEVPVGYLVPFKNHPFQVRSDYQMVELKESIARNGILSPLILRPTRDGMLEIISGHRRKHAADLLGMETVPAIIKNLDYEEAIVEMVDSNIQRENIAPSEKAFAYKMKYDALKRVGANWRRPFYDEDGNELVGAKTIDMIGKEAGDSPKQVQRYLKITQLIPELLSKLDDGIISFNPAVELAFLRKEEQRDLLDAMDYTQSVPSLSQAQRMKKFSRNRTLTLDRMKSILGEVKKDELDRVSFKTCQLRKYFPHDWTPDQMRQEILLILKEFIEQHYENKNGGNENE